MIKVIPRFMKIGVHACRRLVGDLDGGHEDAKTHRQNEKTLAVKQTHLVEIIQRLV